MLRSILADEDLQPYMWINGPGDVYGAHSHDYHKVIYVVRGSITFGLPDSGDEVTLNAGDRLELPTGVTHNAVVGNQGVACLEAHR
jgi:quercetin dioxygenase-like cupin family protein